MPKGIPAMPRYRLIESAYIDDIMYRVDEHSGIYPEIDFDGIPGPHMEPLNQAAKLRVDKYKKQWIDPIRSLEILPTQAPIASDALNNDKASGQLSG